jgi:integrase
MVPPAEAYANPMTQVSRGTVTQGASQAPSIISSPVRRKYLLPAEIELLMAEARKGSRWGHRDCTMILIGYRHGLRAAELCDLQWPSGGAKWRPSARP